MYSVYPAESTVFIKTCVSFHFPQIVVIIVTIILAVMAVYDIILAKQPGGDPTMPVPISGAPATTYNNPGFRDGRPTNGKLIFLFK